MQFTVQQIGSNEASAVEAHNEYEAVAQAAGCSVGEVCVPIWRRQPVLHRDQCYHEQCFMPRDNSGRQWLVRVDTHGFVH